jgi:hypothetical protein
MISVRVAVERKEVIPEPDAVDAELVYVPPRIAKLLDRALLRMDRDADLESLGYA